MRPGANTPEELETLLEDAFLLRDAVALAALFEDGAVLTTDRHRAHGRDEIVREVVRMWESEASYIGAPTRIVQAGEVVLVLGERGAGVLRRDGDRTWRYAISVMF